MGIALSEQGNLESGTEALEKAIIINRNLRTYNNLGNNYRYSDNLDKAVRAYQKAIRLEKFYKL